MRLIAAVVALAMQAVRPATVPPMPYEDHGACPFECCTYREWTAETTVTAHRSHTGPGRRRAVFSIAPGERVVAVTGLVRTTSPGEVRITDEAVLEVQVSNGYERIPLLPGSRLYLLTPHGEGFMRGWYGGRLLDSFDTSRFAPPNQCDKSARCVGVVEKPPQREWWVRVRNQRRQLGWVLMPQGKRAFRGNDACGDPIEKS